MIKEKYQEMQKIVAKYVKAYQSDFAIDIQTLELCDKDEEFLWVVRQHGTHLISRNDVINSEILQYFRDLDNMDGSQKIRYYQIYADMCYPFIIRDIGAYYNNCKNDYEYQQLKKQISNMQ